MKVGLTGATGLVGRHWIERARQAGDEVAGFTRSASRPVRGCVETRAFTEPLDLSGLSAVVHLAGESVFALWTKRKRTAIRESRVQGTRAVVDAIGKMSAADRPKVLISASAVGYYGFAGDARLTEEDSAGRGFLAEVVNAWEKEAFRAERLGVRVVALRIGVVLAKDSATLKRAFSVFRYGLGGTFGSGRQWMSWIHVDDLVEMIQTALHDSTVSGIWNATAPEPARNSDFTRAMARMAGIPAVLPVPALPLKLVLGELSSIFLEGQRVVPRRALAHGFSFAYPNIDSAMERCA